MESLSVSDRVLNLCLERININSVFVAFKVICLAFQGCEIDQTGSNVNQSQHK